MSNSTLGHGAEMLLTALCSPSVPEDRVDVDKRVIDLDVRDWKMIIRAFEVWPFKPSVRLNTDLRDSMLTVVDNVPTGPTEDWGAFFQETDLKAMQRGSSP